ncbi:hypothetical protein WJX81_004921 [Elliptochloris bilobata]|uniref:Glutathione peroxidase n=1 Tax=Elliptochloris bilobata TaxID=381761 RepID=A0AAW1S0Z3_9CHLO
MASSKEWELQALLRQRDSELEERGKLLYKTKVAIEQLQQELAATKHEVEVVKGEARQAYEQQAARAAAAQDRARATEAELAARSAEAQALQVRVGEIEAELRAAGTDAAVLASKLRESERAGSEARAEAATSAAASAGWERLATERGAAVDHLQQEREATKAAAAELAVRVERDRAAASAAAAAAVEAARGEAEALAAVAAARERAAAHEAAAERLRAYEREAADRARQSERDAASRLQDAGEDAATALEQQEALWRGRLEAANAEAAKAAAVAAAEAAITHQGAVAAAAAAAVAAARQEAEAECRKAERQAAEQLAAVERRLADDRGATERAAAAATAEAAAGWQAALAAAQAGAAAQQTAAATQLAEACAQREAAAKQELEAQCTAWQAESVATAAAFEARMAAAAGARDALQARIQALAARLLRLAKREARREKQRGALVAAVEELRAAEGAEAALRLAAEASLREAAAAFKAQLFEKTEQLAGLRAQLKHLQAWQRAALHGQADALPGGDGLGGDVEEVEAFWHEQEMRVGAGAAVCAGGASAAPGSGAAMLAAELRALGIDSRTGLPEQQAPMPDSDSFAHPARSACFNSRLFCASAAKRCTGCAPKPNVNYPGLRELYEKYGNDGFRIIAFPCNQFGGQAPGTDEEERAFAIKKFGIQSLPVMDKLDVNGPTTHPVYAFLKAETHTNKVPWNYWKALCSRDGKPIKSFGPTFDPLNFENDVRLLLAGKEATPSECALHPGRIMCQVERLLSA